MLAKRCHPSHTSSASQTRTLEKLLKLTLSNIFSQLSVKRVGTSDKAVLTFLIVERIGLEGVKILTQKEAAVDSLRTHASDAHELYTGALVRRHVKLLLLLREDNCKYITSVI